MVQGLNIGKNALIVNQAALNVISNNIANMNTVGYSKQRVNLSALYSNTPAMNPTQQAILGYGVELESISRYRDAFTDSYYRDTLSSKSYYDTISQNGLLYESIANEFSDTGLSQYLNSFYAAANNLSLYPTDMTMKTNFAQEASNLATKLNNIAAELKNARTTLVGDSSNPATLKSCTANAYCNEVNQLLTDIARANENIIYQSNIGVDASAGLLDERDALLDKLAEYIPFTTKDNPNGSVNIYLGSYQIVGGSEVTSTFKIRVGDVNNPAKISLENGSTFEHVDDIKSLLGKSGKLGAVLTLGGNSTSELTLKSMMDNLDLIARNVASEVNNLQNKNAAGPPQMHAAYYNPKTEQLEVGLVYDISGGYYKASNASIFTSSVGGTITAANIMVNAEILSNPYKIATAYVEMDGTTIKSPDEIGNNTIAQGFVDLRTKSISGLKNLTFEAFNMTITSDYGSKLSSAKTNLTTQENVYNAAFEKRESIMGVNLEEELMDLVKFQRAYEASAKIVSVSDEILQTLVNMAR